MNKFKEMFHYGCFEKRIIITIIEYVMASTIWIVIDQFITYSLFDEAIAKENIKLAGFEKNITILEGDAEEILKEVEGPFDMIFMDAAKGQYKLFYDMIIDKLRVDGLLISDNILYKGMVAHDDFVIRRKKTIVKRMRNYLDYICNCDYLSTSLIPIGDGVALSYKNKKRGDINE